MVTIDIGHANDEFAQAIERAASQKERVLIQREGTPIAALVPIEDLDDLEQRSASASTGELGQPPPAEERTDSQDTGEALLTMLETIWQNVPEEEWEKLPTDLAEQHDHYVYGLPKRPK
jgi:prevent-host-death family protein